MIQPLPVRALGATGVKPSILGLGGEGILRTFGYEAQARQVIQAAVDEGLTYFDSARAYAGSEQYYGKALGTRRDRIFLTSKAHDRSKAGALAMLDQTLTNMRTAYLDLWQLHDLRTREELEAISAPGGAYEAFLAAKQAGKVRFIGVTGHYDPAILRMAIERLRFDTVLLPVNPCETRIGAFADLVGTRAMELGMGVIGMKVLGRGILVKQAEGLSAADLIRYALSQPVDVVIVGCDDVDQVRSNVAAIRGFAPMAATQRSVIERSAENFLREVLYYRSDDVGFVKQT